MLRPSGSKRGRAFCRRAKHKAVFSAFRREKAAAGFLPPCKISGSFRPPLYNARDLWYNHTDMETTGKNSFILITGACGGLGRAFAFACAERGNLFLTARSAERLAALKEEIAARCPAVRIECFPCDLTDAASRQALFSYIEERGFTFAGLCNVAGVDTQKAFERYTREKIAFQCRVNLEGTLCVTHFALAHRESAFEIVTVGSISGVYPMPYFAIYSATKAALASFFSSLRVELKGQGVKVTTVQPGGIPTRPDIIEDIKGQGLWGRLSAKSPQFVAKKSLAAVQKNRRICIPGFWNKVIARVPKLVPLSWRMHFIARRWKKLEKDAF